MYIFRFVFKVICKNNQKYFVNKLNEIKLSHG